MVNLDDVLALLTVQQCMELESNLWDNAKTQYDKSVRKEAEDYASHIHDILYELGCYDECYC